MREFIKELKWMLLSPKLYVIFVIPFLAWLYLFRGFILSDYTLITDAVVYCDHFQYFIENLGRGVLPFWEPTFYGGVPTEFFYRRIGEYNPFYVFILVLYKSGWPFLIAYLTFLSVYYFLGMIGFFLACRKVLNNDYAAYAAYLLLFFSTLSTFLFCSFIILIFTPMAWFFYFLLTFMEKREKYTVLGATFCLMILAITYIPFYFLTIFLSFTIFFLFTYSRESLAFGAALAQFARQNKLFTIGCLLMLVLSSVPGVRLYQDFNQGQMVLPTRNYNAPVKSTLSVPAQRSDFGGIIPHLIVNELYFGVKDIGLSRIYVPFFFHFLLLMAFVVKLNRRLVFFFLWGYAIFVISLYDAPIYKFLYEHIFFFKYFRNFQFFFWFAILPIFILLCAEQFRSFLNMKRDSRFQKAGMLLFIVLSHALTFAFLCLNYHKQTMASFAVVSLSFLFFVLYWKGWLRQRPTMILWFLLGVIVIDPFEAYRYLNKNSKEFISAYRYELDKFYYKPKLQDEERARQTIMPWPMPKDVRPATAKEIQERKYIYFGSKTFQSLYQNIGLALDRYMSRWLIVYDRVQYMSDESVDMDRIARAFATNENVAFVSSPEAARDHPVPSGAGPLARIVTKESRDVKVLAYDVNFIKLKTNFRSPKFLVFNDNDHPDWKLFVNGKAEKIVRANVSFKGVWLAPGENIVYYRFGNAGKTLEKIFFVILFSGVFMYFLILSVRASEGRHFQYPWKT